jgi:hypothetical protein
VARKTKKQQEMQAAVEDRLTGEGPVRVDASAVTSGRSGGAVSATTKSVVGIHPSLEGATEAIREAGLQGGTVTTPSGLSVRVARPKPQPQGAYRAQLPAQEGVSQRFEQQIGRDHGPDAAARFTAEAEEIAARPNPLRSDGLVDAVMSLHSPSVGGNRRKPGSLSGLAKLEDARLPQSKVSIPKSSANGSNFPSASQEPYATGPRDLALKTLGYSDAVQNVMLKTARDRVSRRQGRGGFAALTPVEVESRAQGQVQEHLDEALHGTRRVGHEAAVINDAISSGGVGIETAAGPANRAGAMPVVKAKGGGLGMTPTRTPEQRAMRSTARDLVRGGKWNALRDSDALTTAVNNDLELITAKQKARRAAGAHPETFNTMSVGAAPEQAGRRNAQPVFSTSNPGVGTPAPGKTLPPVARAGAVSPVPPNLPSGPAEIGRSRAERSSTFPTGSEPVVAPKPGKKAPVKKAAAAGGSGGIGNWSPSQGLAAQTEKPAPLAGTGIQSGLGAARAQNVSLGQRGATGARSAYKAIR